MNLRHPALLAAVLAGGALAAACKDVPFAPKWDADWTVPLPVTPIRLDSVFPVSVVLPGMSGPVNTPPQKQTLDKAIGQVLQQTIALAVLKLTYTMPLAFSGADTLFVAADSAGLANPAAARIIFPISLAQTSGAGTDVVDTLRAGSPGLALIQNAGTTGGALWIQIRGRVGNQGSTPIIITSSDVVGLAFELTARIAISR